MKAKTKTKVKPPSKHRAKPVQAGLPLEFAPRPVKLPHIAFNQEVTLKSDRTYIGVKFGTQNGGYVCTTKQPGKNGKRGVQVFPIADVIPYVKPREVKK